MYCGPLSAPTITTVRYVTELTFAPICVETIAAIHGYECSQLGTRPFRINGMDRSSDCDGNGRTTLPAKANGGYCLQLTPGVGDFAYFQTY